MEQSTVRNKFARRAAEIVGGINVLADKLGISRQTIYNWGEEKVPAERVIAIEKATDGQISRHEMRADIYPPEDAHEAPARPTEAA